MKQSTLPLATTDQPCIPGLRYRVTVVYGGWANWPFSPKWWPVIGPMHTDPDLKFKPIHWHVDARFLDKRAFEMSDYGPRSGYNMMYYQPLQIVFDPVTEEQLMTPMGAGKRSGSILSGDRGKPHPKLLTVPEAQSLCSNSVKIAIRLCKREFPPPPDYKKYQAFADMQARYTDRKDSVAAVDGRWCPHRRTDLRTVRPGPDGIVVCPLHGLRVRCAP